MPPKKNDRSRLGRKIILPALLVLVLIAFLARDIFKSDSGTAIDTKTDRWTIGYDTLRLEFPKDEFRQLQSDRELALAKGLILAEDIHTIKGMIHTRVADLNVKARLKGDWPDHLKGEKWSLRINILEGKAWRRLRSFSIQDPERRKNLDEWLFHRFLYSQDILTTRYDFIFVEINGKELGVFAIEEHFDEALIAFNRRKPGPILKFDEGAMWRMRAAEMETELDLTEYYDFHSLAPISLFQPNKFLKDKRSNQIKAGLTLVNQYRTGSIPLETAVDLDQAAKQQAANDLFRAYHNMIWHNMRFYYDPVAQELEPIVYDAYSGTENVEYVRHAFVGYGRNGNHVRYDSNYAPGEYLFESDKFMRRYYEWLAVYTDSSFVEKFLSDYSPELKARAEIISIDEGGFKFDADKIRNNARRIRTSLSAADHFTVEGVVRDSVLRVKSYSPIALEVLHQDSLVGFLHAHDRRYLPDSCDVPVDLIPNELRVRVPGQKGSGRIVPFSEASVKEESAEQD